MVIQYLYVTMVKIVKKPGIDQPPLLVANRLILCLADDKDAERRIDSNRIAGSIVFHAP